MNHNLIIKKWFSGLEIMQQKHFAKEIGLMVPFWNSDKPMSPEDLIEIFDAMPDGNDLVKDRVKLILYSLCFKFAVTQIFHFDKYPNDEDDFLDWINANRTALNHPEIVRRLREYNGLSEASRDDLHAWHFKQRIHAKKSWEALGLESIGSL